VISPAVAFVLVLQVFAGTLTTPLPRPPHTVAVGDRVRVRAAGLRFTGTVTAADPTTLVVLPGAASAPVTLTWPEIRSLERSTGCRRYVVEGAMAGFLLGTVGGALIGSRQCGRGDFAGICQAVWGLRGMGAGVVLGLVAGLQSSDDWQPARGPHIGLRAVPYRDGAAMAVSWHF
jgi:hypothetical protein